MVRLAVTLLLLVGCGAEATGPNLDDTDMDPGPGDDGEADPPTPMPPPSPPEVAATVRVMTYNIKHGELSSLEEVAAVIRSEEPDIVALQEVDKETVRSNGIYQSYRLGQLTGLASSYRGALPYDGGEYGIAVLSRFPILSSTRLNLTSAGEQRIAVAWKLMKPDGQQFVIVNTHLSLSAAERATQVQELVSFAGDAEADIIVGDLNAEPNAAELAPLSSFLDAQVEAGDGYGFSIPSQNPDRRIDYIFVDDTRWQPLDTYVVESTASDHRPVVAELE